MPERRIAVVGNVGGGKSTLARLLARTLDLPLVEIDRLLWQPGWVAVPPLVYEERHRSAIAEPSWVIEGLGRRFSIRDRLDRATEIVLVDFPLWMHFWLAAERQVEWSHGRLSHPPGGLEREPAMQALCKTIWDVDRDWLPEIRVACDAAERLGKPVRRLRSVQQLDRYAAALAEPRPSHATSPIILS
ncbi:MAG: adenylate kinase [Gluconacetobacter diazotrophicus]|nr:adenylate kinase [Gluconacetobacter diazotrophicus]